MKTLAKCILILLALGMLSACKKDTSTPITKEKISGYVQKGPYINGTSILMSELNKSLEQTGKIFSTQINDNSGSFEINDIALSSSYVQFVASGFYYDEVEGDISQAQLSLYALSDLQDITSVNVNILTHLEKRRVEYLVDNGSGFSEAKSQAQDEILAIFGITDADISNSEALDISLNSEGNAILLAISIIIQGNRTEGEVTELLASIGSDMVEDGLVDDLNIINDLRYQVATILDLSDIRLNLESRYQELGISASIPDFEKYINDFLLFSAYGPSGITQDASDININSAILHGIINPNSSTTSVTFEYGNAYDYGSLVVATPASITGSEAIEVSAEVDGLLAGNDYHFRVVAENENGVFYGPDKVFRTDSFVYDIDGNIYRTRIFGNKKWMLENLKTTRFDNGTNIPIISTDPDNYDHQTNPAYTWYNHDEATYKDPYGAYYNAFAVNTGRLCPSGWHVPDSTDWANLAVFVGGEFDNGAFLYAGGMLKEAGTTHWNSPNTGATNQFEFTALPGGSSTSMMGEYGFWWTSTLTVGDQNVYYQMKYDNDELNIADTARDAPLSVRCVRDH